MAKLYSKFLRVLVAASVAAAAVPHVHAQDAPSDLELHGITSGIDAMETPTTLKEALAASHPLPEQFAKVLSATGQCELDGKLR